MLQKKKRKARDAITQAHEAMQEAKRLQAEANAKYAAAEALLEKFGLADVPPQPTPPQKGAEALNGRVRVMSAYQSNVASSTIQGNRAASPPTPMLPHGAVQRATGCRRLRRGNPMGYKA